MAGVTGRQGMLTPPRHLIPPPVFPGVRVSPFVYLTFNSYLNFETEYSSVSWPFLHATVFGEGAITTHFNVIDLLWRARVGLELTTSRMVNESTTTELQ
jgi:hypothetical protein